jgi:hypothetical protein
MSLELMALIFPATVFERDELFRFSSGGFLPPESSSGWQRPLIIQVMAVDSLTIFLVQPAVPQVHSNNDSISLYIHD